MQRGHNPRGNRGILFIPPFSAVNSRSHVLVCLARPTFYSRSSRPSSSFSSSNLIARALFRRNTAAPMRVHAARVRVVRVRLHACTHAHIHAKNEASRLIYVAVRNRYRAMCLSLRFVPLSPSSTRLTRSSLSTRPMFQQGSVKRKCLRMLITETDDISERQRRRLPFPRKYARLPLAR